GGAAVEAPHREVGQLRHAREFLHLGFAAEVGDRLVAIEPDVFEFVFRHCFVGRCIFLNSLRYFLPQFWAVLPCLQDNLGSAGRHLSKWGASVEKWKMQAGHNSRDPRCDARPAWIAARTLIATGISF